MHVFLLQNYTKLDSYIRSLLKAPHQKKKQLFLQMEGFRGKELEFKI